MKTHRVAIVSPGDSEARRSANGPDSRFADLFQAFSDNGIVAELMIYHDDFSDEVESQLLNVDAALVWVNPVQGGCSRAVLDQLLRRVSASGVYVSTHPDVVLKLGTKEVLYQTRHLGWGSDTGIYRSMIQMAEELPRQLSKGNPRVLKQYRGSSGDGVWQVQLADTKFGHQPHLVNNLPNPGTLLKLRHAKRGCIEETATLEEFYRRCEGYFTDHGLMIDQLFQPRLAEGMIRCYLVYDKVVGFGCQAINALYPAPPGGLPTDAPQPGARLYHPPDVSEYQLLKQRLEQEWVAAACETLDIQLSMLPILWDCDFLLGPKTENGEDTYVLCEINVSSVAPYPPSAVQPIVNAVAAHLS